MKSKFSFFVIITLALMLSACFKVEDNSNSQLNATLQQQNEILRQQLEQGQNQGGQEEQEKTVSIAGQVADAFDESVISTATVSVKNSFDVFIDALAVTNGTFLLEGLPPNTDIEIAISSPTNAFLERAFYVNTGPSDSVVTQRDMGKFNVSEPVTYSITVMNDTAGEPLTGLEFSASSTSGSGIGEEAFEHVSTFDESNGVYNIVVPRYINVQVEASLDADRDGRLDFNPLNPQFVFGTNISINSTELQSLPTLSFVELDVASQNQVEFRLALVNVDGTFITEANVGAANNMGEEFVAVFDAATNQYVLNTSFANGVNIQVPAFTASDISYSSISIEVSEETETQFFVSITGSNNRDNFYRVDKSELINLVVRPSLITADNTDLTVVTASNPALSADNSYTVFYSKPISVADDQVTLFNNNAFSVVKGDASTSDVVLPGTTVITFGEEIPVTTELSLNGTQLTITPNAPLLSENRYQYNVASVKVAGSDALVDISGDSSLFTAPVIVSDIPFVITDLVLDNQNFANAGERLVPANTAGVPSNSFIGRSSATIFIPETVNQLKTLSLNKVSFVRDGVSSNSFQSYELVSDGMIQNAQKYITLRLSSNENIQTIREGFNFNDLRTVNGTSLSENGIFYQTFFRPEFLADDTPTNENSVTFQYAFETKAGVVETGVVTLPVQ